MNFALIWLLVFGALVIVETFTMEFSSLSLALGALAGAAAAALGLSLPLQGATAAVCAVASLFLLAPILRKRLTPRDTATGTDALIGQEAMVVEAICPPSQGKVKLDGVVWQAVAGEEIQAGQAVLVTDLKGSRLTVVAQSDLEPLSSTVVPESSP